MSIRQQLAQSFKDKVHSTDFWFISFLYLCLGFAFLPITVWMAQSAEAQSRLLHALIVLLFACILLIRFGRIEIKQPLTLNKPAQHYLYAAYGLLVLGFITQQFSALQTGALGIILPFIAIPAYCLALGSSILFVFGEGTQRLARTASGTLCAFLLLSVLMGPLDWPLRALAGKSSGAVLDQLGQATELGLHRASESAAPQLILIVNEHPFHVASECNGFGVILTSLLIALLLAIYRRLNILNTALNLIAGITLGFAFNTLRIIIIVLLAPYMMEHYLLMHEIIGTLTYWGCLALVWLLLNGPINDEPASKT